MVTLAGTWVVEGEPEELVLEAGDVAGHGMGRTVDLVHRHEQVEDDVGGPGVVVPLHGDRATERTEVLGRSFEARSFHETDGLERHFGRLEAFVLARDLAWGMSGRGAFWQHAAAHVTRREEQQSVLLGVCDLVCHALYQSL